MCFRPRVVSCVRVGRRVVQEWSRVVCNPSPVVFPGSVRAQSFERRPFGK